MSQTEKISKDPRYKNRRRLSAIKIMAAAPAIAVTNHTGRVLRNGRVARFGVIIAALQRPAQGVVHALAQVIAGLLVQLEVVVMPAIAEEGVTAVRCAPEFNRVQLRAGELVQRQPHQPGVQRRTVLRLEYSMQTRLDPARHRGLGEHQGSAAGVFHRGLFA